MKYAFAAVLAAIVLSTASIAAPVGGSEPGFAYCFGVACPCGNDDPAAGCMSSTGAGALLTASGTTSVAANDLTFHVSGVPQNANGTFYMGTTQIVLPVGDGLRCAGGSTYRFPGHQNSGGTGTYTWDNLVPQTPHLIAPGTTWYFQAFFRDVPPANEPCGNFPNANLSNGYAVTFAP